MSDVPNWISVRCTQIEEILCQHGFDYNDIHFYDNFEDGDEIFDTIIYVRPGVNCIVFDITVMVSTNLDDADITIAKYMLFEDNTTDYVLDDNNPASAGFLDIIEDILDSQN